MMVHCWLMRAIIRTSVFIDRSLKRQLDAISMPRTRKSARACYCGASAWIPCGGNANPSTAYFTCDVCTRRRKLTLILASVTSATDGSGVADVMIREFFDAPCSLPLHDPVDKVMVGLYMPRDLHEYAKTYAATEGATLSCLLASIIAARLSKAPRVRTQKRREAA